MLLIRLMVTFSTAAEHKHRRSLASTKLYGLMRRCARVWTTWPQSSWV